MGDNIVLQQCMRYATTHHHVLLLMHPPSLLRRIEGHTRTKKEPLNELQHDISALEILNDVSKLIREVRRLYVCSPERYSMINFRANL